MIAAGSVPSLITFPPVTRTCQITALVCCRLDQQAFTAQLCNHLVVFAWVSQTAGSHVRIEY